MNKKIFSICFLISLLVLPCQPQAKLFNGETFRLENGLQVIVIPNHKAPIIKHMVYYKVGSMDEPIGKGGVAHLLEHLMFRGTEKVKGNNFNRILEENGADSNAFTSTDMTAYHQMLDISRLELAMFLEADRMQNLKISEKDFELERDIVFQERKERVDNNPPAYFGEAVRRTLWQDHPYARPVTGTEEEILSLTKKDVTDFYNKFYAPNNAVLVLAGDIDTGTAKKLANKYYGSVKKKSEIEKKTLPELESTFQASLEMSRPQIQSYRIMKSWAADSYNVHSENIYPLQVLAAYLGDGETSKLYKKLVLGKKIALGISADYNPASRSYGSFTISAIPQNGVKAEVLLDEINKAWEESLIELNSDEIERVKRKMLAGFVYLRDNPSDAAAITGTMAAVGMPLEEIEAQEEKIRAVNFKDVLMAARRLQNDIPQITGILKPEVKEAD